MADAAEAAVAPVRLGISKPLGANSVSADYLPRGAPSSHPRHPQTRDDPQRSLARELHVRFAFPSDESPSGTRSVAPPTPAHYPLPSEGIALRPRARDEHGAAASASGGQSAGGTSKGFASGDDCFEDMDDSSDNDPNTSFESEAGVGVRGGGGDGVMRELEAVPAFYSLAPPTVMPGGVEEIVLDLDPASSDEDDFPLLDTFRGGAETVWAEPEGRGGGASAPLEEVYPFAWALDGRRIGEQTLAGRRSTSPSSFMFGSSPEPPIPISSIPSIRFGAGFLARTFSRFVKDLVDITTTVCEGKSTEPSLRLPPSTASHLLLASLGSLERTWRWLASVLDVAEGQLQQGKNFDAQRYVMSLRGSGPSAGVHSFSRLLPRSFIGSTPGEYVTYLLRAQSREADESLPVLDLYGYEHVVYILDSLIYTLTNWPKAATTLANQSDSSRHEVVMEMTNQTPASTSSSSAVTTEDIEASGTRFFERTESVILGGDDSDTHKDKDNEHFFGTEVLGKPHPMAPPPPQNDSLSHSLMEAYPLAHRPHLLKPYAKKEHLFSASLTGGGRSESGGSGEGGARPGGGDKGGGGGGGGGGKRKFPVSHAHYHAPSLHSPSITLSWSSEHALQRWSSTISVFAHIFLAEGPGGERSNFLNARAGFASRMARFRHQVQQLYNASQSHRDWASTVSSTLSVRVRRDHLLQDSLDTLQQMVRFHYSQVRVKFEGEDGSGPGVNRGFFASLANELKRADPSKSPVNRLGVLFHEPGKEPEQSGLFSPAPFFPPHGNTAVKNSSLRSQRRIVFKAIGRFLGLCFWFKYTVPFMVCRHVAKFLLGRELAWHDLAFYNSDLFEGLRRMMLDVEEGKRSREDFMATYCCYFEAPLTGQGVESVLVDLIPGGSKVPVTPDRVQEYVRLYATFMMVGCVKEELQAMKEGLMDVIPAELLSGLTAEDFQLLLSGGSAALPLARLKSVIHFNHTHGSSESICDRFEKMFWRVVSHMSNTQRQQLLYFATGSAALPATSDTTSATPVAITIDVIGSGNTESLPVASTCSQRMSVPFYPSYHILRKKLLQAIQCQAYGLG